MSVPETSRGRFSRIREPFCGLSHSAGAVLSVFGLLVLLWSASGDILRTVAFSIYGLSLVALYTASGLYHSLCVPESGIERLKRFDHCAIYLLIAGTYTPVFMVAVRGALGTSILAVEWTLAALGIAATLFMPDGPPSWLPVVLYLVMGWLALPAMGALRHALPAAAVGWLVAGGLFYTFGTVIYAADRPHLWPGRFTAHDLWHLFVMAGSASHFVLMLVFIAPVA